MKLKLNLNLLAVVLLGSATAFAGGRSIDQSTKPWVNAGSAKSEKKVQVSLSTGSLAMACEKCTSVTELKKRDIGTKPGHGQELVAVSVHQCAGCRDEMVRKQGTKEMAMVHKCADCGSKSLTCCASSPKSPTKGMESLVAPQG